jgi:predicted esterase
MEQREIFVRSTLDGSMQPNLFYGTETEEKRPLLVALHSWSFDRFNQVKAMLPRAEKVNFNLLLPEFRGNNSRKNPHCTEACGSELAKQDICDAIDYCIENENVDPENIFLVGYSGGGHMALLLAGKCPERFKAIAAGVPITDIKLWIETSPNRHKYAASVMACCSNSEEEMKKRSPMTYLDTIAKANLKIFHGKFDPVVPVEQSLMLYRELMTKYPESRVFLDVFDGAHQMDREQVMYWLLSQYQEIEKIEVTG